MVISTITEFPLGAMFIRSQRGSAVATKLIESIKALTTGAAENRPSGNGSVWDFVEGGSPSFDTFSGCFSRCKRPALFASATMVFVAGSSAVRNLLKWSWTSFFAFQHKSMRRCIECPTFITSALVARVASNGSVPLGKSSLIRRLLAMTVATKNLALAQFTNAFGYRHPERVAALTFTLDVIAVKIIGGAAFHAATALFREPCSADFGIVKHG